MSCKIKTRHIDGMIVVELIGDVTNRDTGPITKKMESLRNGDCPRIVIDLTETTFIDSYGLGVFVYFWKVLSEHDRELIFCNPQNFVGDIFTGTNLSQVFRVVESLEEL